MRRRFLSRIPTLTWLAGAVLGVSCSIPDYAARQTTEEGGAGGDDDGRGGVAGQTMSGGTAGNGPMGGSAGNPSRGGNAGDPEGGSSGSGPSGGDAGNRGGTGGNNGGASGGGAGRGGAGNGGVSGSAGRGGAGSGGASGSAGNGGAGNGGAGNGGVGGGAGNGGVGGGAGKGGAGNGGAGAGNGGAGAGNGGAGAGNGGSGGGGPVCITPNSNNLVENAGFDSSVVTAFVAVDSFIQLSHSTLDATDCASSGSLVVTNSAPNGLNSGAIQCITTISPGMTFNVGGRMMEPSGFAMGQLSLQFLFTDGPNCTGSFVGNGVFLQPPLDFDGWRSLRQDGVVAPVGAVSLGVHVRAIKNLPNAMPYRALFDMLYATPVPGEF